MNQFHAGGQMTLASEPHYKANLEKEKRQRFEELLGSYREAFARLGYHEKQRFMKALHRQVDREFNLDHRLF